MSKASNLEKLMELGLNVPYFRTLQSEDEVDLAISDIFLTDRVSVRSSGTISTPGRMNTYLDIKKEEISEYVKKVFNSGQSKRVREFLAQINYAGLFQVECIIQNYIPVIAPNDFSAVIHARMNGDSTMQYANVPGDQLMAGAVTPMEITLSRNLPIYSDIQKILKHFNCNQEIEITISDGTVYFLQTRNLKDTASETLEDDIMVSGEHVTFAVYTIATDRVTGILTRDINHACPSECLFLTDDTTFDDLEKLLKFKAILTTRGGSMCHTGAIARLFNKNVWLSIKDPTKLIDNMQYTCWMDGQLTK